MAFAWAEEKRSTQIQYRSSKQKREELLREKVKEFKKKKYNSKCADCGCKYASYVVTNFGIFICTDCSTHHRHYHHRVKSITLDTFTQSDVDMLYQNGNKKSNRKYLANYKHPQEKIRCNAGFIRDKYIRHKWIQKDDITQQPIPKKSKKKKKKRKKKQKEDEKKDKENDDIFADFGAFNDDNKNDDGGDYLFNPFGMNDENDVNDEKMDGKNNWNPFMPNYDDGKDIKSTDEKRKGSVVLEQSQTNEANNDDTNPFDPFSWNNSNDAINDNNGNNEWTLFGE